MDIKDNNKYSLANYVREPLPFPTPGEKFLLHSCCAPCASEIMLALKESNIDTTIFFYNPNIHPVEEYEVRKNENIRYARKLNFEFVDVDYNTSNWFSRVKGLEWEPERGKRCTVCFDMRFERTALYAFENGYRVMSSTLGISRWKNMTQINECGIRAASRYPSLKYWDYNWRKRGGSARMIEISKEEQFYQQEYCGCYYSLRDTNKWRRSQSRSVIRIKERFYTKKDNRHIESESK